MLKLTAKKNYFSNKTRNVSDHKHKKCKEKASLVVINHLIVGKKLEQEEKKECATCRSHTDGILQISIVANFRVKYNKNCQLNSTQFVTVTIFLSSHFFSFFSLPFFRISFFSTRNFSTCRWHGTEKKMNSVD